MLLLAALLVYTDTGTEQTLDICCYDRPLSYGDNGGTIEITPQSYCWGLNSCTETLPENKELLGLNVYNYVEPLTMDTLNT